jgi:hypothetical protein
VKDGSLKRNQMTVEFVITDTARDLPVRYSGILPDLFKEGKGAVAQGRLGANGEFVASEVLAKHDENYMPPEAKHAVDTAHKAAAPRRTLNDARTRPPGPDPRAAGRGRAGHAAADRRAAQRRRLDRARAAGRADAVPAGRDRVRLPDAAFCRNDFSVSYVAQHSNSKLPTVYRAAAVWGGHEGSLLLWVLMLNGWTLAGHAAVAPASRRRWSRVCRRARARRDRLPPADPHDLEPVRAAAARPPRRTRPEPAAAGPGLVFHPADALHGLRRLLGRVRVRDRGAAVGPARRAWARWSRPWTTGRVGLR